MTLANDLRELSDAGTLGNKAVLKALDYVETELKIHAATTGQRSFVFHVPTQHRLTYEKREKILNLLRQKGITVTEHPNPGPAHPCAGAYTELSW